ncbi:peptidase [Lewinellaceae bacterium SD302]|nr:peptidase [Lewinellaceae bacterium SD302]
MRYLFLSVSLLLTLSLFAQSPKKKTPTFTEKVASLKAYTGFYDFYWSEEEGKIYLAIPENRLGEDFLYVNSLSAGLGSNDIGLDRNQLGNNRVVHFERSGPKILLLERNLRYRAISDNEDEKQSVADAFASSALAGFKLTAQGDGKLLVDMTPMLLSDAHGVARRLKSKKQGSFKVDAARSAVYLPRTKNFPQNSEFEALVTFSGEATGSQLRSVSPNGEAFSLRMHHSFVELPDDNYQPRTFDPRSGYFVRSYADYATPISQPLQKRFITRHRLEKKDPAAKVTTAKEPIVYYLDRGAPEPIRSALIEGASWWNQAFEAAGYENAFQVKLLPEDADPLDVRYNVINWVHRSTRGWSYGSSVVDPRTGEIIKGHVLLGSLRVRQDFLIAQGLIDAYGKDGITPDPRMEALALARLRQLSAHEVGHTIGLAHNFAASTNDRSSVMDYPHPYAFLDEDGSVNLEEAYAVGIGEWDKRTVLYGYQDFPSGTDERQQLIDILEENDRLGLSYISDADARPVGSAQPSAHLWDNGANAARELERIGQVRQSALKKLNINNIPDGTPLSELERVFVPVYLMHRYQVEGAAKLIGGVRYDYSVNSGSYDGSGYRVTSVKPERQNEAFAALVNTLKPAFLEIPPDVRKLLFPPAQGYGRGREYFSPNTGSVFDPLAAATASAEHSLKYLLHPDRLERVHQQFALDQSDELLSLRDFLASIEARLADAAANESDLHRNQIAEAVHHRFVQHLLALAATEKNSPAVRGEALQLVNNLSMNGLGKGHTALIEMLVAQFNRDPKSFKPAPAPRIPDGSPIGCGGVH